MACRLRDFPTDSLLLPLVLLASFATAGAQDLTVRLDELTIPQVLLLGGRGKLACFGEQGLLGKLTPHRAALDSRFSQIDTARTAASLKRRLREARHRLKQRAISERVRRAAARRRVATKRSLRALFAGMRACRDFGRSLERTNSSSVSAGSNSSAGSMFSSTQSSSAVSTSPGECEEIRQYGITWTFDKPYACGQFANGDWWVVGPLVLARITPEYGSGRHGWEINPESHVFQGFDSRVKNFDASRVLTLPQRVSPDQSIVKTISRNPSDAGCTNSCVQTAAVLSVVGEIPVDKGATLFRPNYFGSRKHYHSIAEIDTNRLLSLAPVQKTPALASMENEIRRLQMDHKEGIDGRPQRPYDNMPDYGASIGTRNADIVLRLALNDPIETKMPALIGFLQYGLDMYYGAYTPAYDRTTMGTKLAIAFTAVLLGNRPMKDFIIGSGPNDFNENHDIYVGSGSKIPLYGRSNTELSYWSHMIRGTMGGKDQRDPYGYIDGGDAPGSSYQLCCSGMPWKATAAAVQLTLGLKEVWNNQNFFDYVERWVSHGTWSQPDPCAPADVRDTVAKSMDYYGITYGPDGSGGCIPDMDPSDGIGRFPNRHGLSANTGGYGSEFANAMWNSYYKAAL